MLRPITTVYFHIMQLVAPLWAIVYNSTCQQKQKKTTNTILYFLEKILQNVLLYTTAIHGDPQ